MSLQLPLLKPEDRVPVTTEHSGKVIDGFHVLTASDMAMVRSGVTFARVTGSMGDKSFVYDMGEIVRWAIVERMAS